MADGSGSAHGAQGDSRCMQDCQAPMQPCRLPLNPQPPPARLQQFNTLIALTGVILYWRGVWNLFDT